MHRMENTSRTLTLTEELEKLEQSITLTLQEIDHNFSRAHRIVTSSILPVVENYAEHSQDIWEGSKFWKQFFEASANVSLSSYEEPQEQMGAEQADGSEDAELDPSSSQFDLSEGINSHVLDTPQAEAHQAGLSPAADQETPRPQSASVRKKILDQSHYRTAAHESPYKTLKRDLQQVEHRSQEDSDLPSTPRYQQGHGMDHLGSSPFAPPSTSHKSTRQTPANDPLLHRVLDRNWRIQATPHGTASGMSGQGRTMEMSETNKATPAMRQRFQADDPDSSPAVPTPQLHAEIFGPSARQPRTPGVSVLTPGKNRLQGTRRKDAVTPGDTHDRQPLQRGINLRGNDEDAFDDVKNDEEDDSLLLDMSPPKTIQFHIPQSRLVKTPAREASKRIVEDLIHTAGGNISEDLLEESPSIVKRGGLDEDDTF